MEDNLIGKCYKDRNTLLYVAGPFEYALYHVCKKVVKLTKDFGYVSNTDILFLRPDDLVEFDPIIWSKIHKILKMNTISCNTIIQNCEKYKSSTGYYVSTHYIGTSSVRTYYKLFELLKNSQSITRFSDSQVWIKELEDEAVKFETMFSTDREWISPETYHKVKDNVTNTIEKIDDIWTTI